ncbi:family 43 glycosylhydrolase [Thalassobellus suaedae]|uniref:Family 43 glycosylhydrolase n=1 Tax=Thalassobellus suaedae TaxID=3074124 RepID=A0ABY9XTT9_9FLAO|nr:family 43 glycosylhydrolase [Flavobacteriaceae bacterium HL-DH14]
MDTTRSNKPIVEQRADPFIYKHKDGYYYFTGSVPTYDCIELRRAKTIAELQNAQTFNVWQKHKSGSMSRHIWAPEIHYLDGKWYVYFAASEEEDIWKLRPYVLECTGQNPLNDEWIELGQMQPADDDNKTFIDFSLDGTVFDHNGKRYFCYRKNRRTICSIQFVFSRNGIANQIENGAVHANHARLRLGTHWFLGE